MNPNLTVTDVATWLRRQAKEFNRIADTLEQTFSSPLLPSSSPIQTNITPIRGQHLVAYLHQKGASRVKSIADFFNVPTEVIDTLIDQNEHLFEVGERGWIKLAAQPKEVQRQLDEL